jgi:formylglycine-generating enzyme required for sulfatase activity
MHGNVVEGCQDRYGMYATSVRIAQQGSSSGPARVLWRGYLAGGAWLVRSANRGSTDPDARGGDVGFGLLRTE